MTNILSLIGTIILILLGILAIVVLSFIIFSVIAGIYEGIKEDLNANKKDKR